jgi:hypothetical protein
MVFNVLGYSDPEAISIIVSSICVRLRFISCHYDATATLGSENGQKYAIMLGMGVSTESYTYLKAPSIILKLAGKHKRNCARNGDFI